MELRILQHGCPGRVASQGKGAGFCVPCRRGLLQPTCGRPCCALQTSQRWLAYLERTAVGCLGFHV
eukprot:7063569-Alexandrium_andersonii.AAC.1